MEKKKIQDVCIVNPPQYVKLSGDMKVSFLPMTAVSTDGRIDLTKTLESEKIKNYSVFQNGDVLFAKITPCMENGKGAIADNLLNGYGAGSTEFIVLRPKSDIISSKWLFLYLSQQSFRQECKQHMTGSAGQKRVQPKYLASCTVPVPPLSEQKRIVARIEELFSELDKAVETLNTTKQQVAVYRQTVVSKAFPEMTAENKVRLDEISDISGGITKGRNLEKHETLWLPYLRVANVQNGFLELSEMKTIELKASEKDKYLLQKGDVLYTEGGDRDKLGRGTVWNDEIQNCVHQNHIFKARLKKTRAIPEYVSYWSMSSFARNYFYNKGKQSVNLASINKTVLSALTLPLPPLEEQVSIVREIESRLTVCDNIERTVDTALLQAEALRQSILKQAFEGKLI